MCVQRRGGGGKPACGDRGGLEVHAGVERALAGRPGAGARVTATQCLGPCFDGPNAVVYPDGCWYAALAAEDAAALARHLVDGEPHAPKAAPPPGDE